MNTSRTLTIAACAVVLAALPSGVAHAGVDPGIMGGGAMLPEDGVGTGNMLITLEATPDDRVRIHASVELSCQAGAGLYVEAAVFPVAVVAPDGTFRATGTRMQSAGARRFRTVYDIAGAITASGARGTATVSFHDPADLSNPVCGSPRFPPASVAWQARRETTFGTPGAITGGLRYGVSSPSIRGTRGAIILRVSPDGKTVERVLHRSALRCRRRSVSTTRLDREPWVSLEEPARIRLDGGFDQRSELQVTGARQVIRLSSRIAGTLGTLGARGTYRYNGRIFNPRSGRTRESCTTAVGWWAAP